MFIGKFTKFHKIEELYTIHSRFVGVRAMKESIWKSKWIILHVTVPYEKSQTLLCVGVKTPFSVILRKFIFSIGPLSINPHTSKQNQIINLQKKEQDWFSKLEICISHHVAKIYTILNVLIHHSKLNLFILFAKQPTLVDFRNKSEIIE